jgi:hypothetical protein
MPGPPAFVPFSVNRQLSAQAGAQEDYPGKFHHRWGALMDSGDQHEREVRAARNQALFRAVNEKLRALNDSVESLTGTFTIACECADTNCVDMLDIRPEEYRAIRAEPRTFAVLPGHVFPDVERVVRQSDGHLVVEKLGAGAQMAEILDTDARS